MLTDLLCCCTQSLVVFSRLNCCGADPWALAAIGWSRRIYQ